MLHHAEMSRGFGNKTQWNEKKNRFYSEIFLEWKWNVDSDTIRYKNEPTVSFRIFVSQHVCISHDLKSFFCINLTNALCEEAFAPIFWSFFWRASERFIYFLKCHWLVWWENKNGIDDCKVDVKVQFTW